MCIRDREYANGQTFDLELLAEAAHDHNALLVVDATQSAGAIPIDVQKSPIDVLVSGAYKWLCGPFGAAFMYVAPHLMEKLEPGLVGFRSHENMWDLDGGRIKYPATGRKFEFSTMAFGSALGLAESINYINDLGVDYIFEHNHRLAQRLIEGLQARGAEITSPLGGEDRSAIVMAYFEHNDPDEMIIELPVTMQVGSDCGDTGDVNGDGDVNVLDIVQIVAVSYTHLRAHETEADLVCRLLLEKI